MIMNIEKTEFPDRVFDVMLQKGIDNAPAVNAVIKECSESGGGRVVIPAGIWYCTPIELKSNVELHLERGAVLSFSDNYKDYPLINTFYEGFFTWRCVSPVYCKDCENVAITGEGIIEGNGGAWRPIKNWKMTDRQWKAVISKGGYVAENSKEKIWWPSELNAEADELFKKNAELYKDKETCEKYHQYLRPALVNFTRCKRVLIEGVTIQNSPAWALHPWLCSDIIIRDVTLRNPWYSQNGDGLDLECCKNAIVDSCSFDVGDDAICMKSGKNEDGRKLGVPTENVLIKDCTVFHGHGGFVIGSEMSGGLKNVKVEDCTFIGTDVGLRFKSCLGRGGVVENINISGINMAEIAEEAIIFTMGYNMDTKEGQKVSEEEIPEFKEIHISNVYCSYAKTAVKISGLPEKPVHDIYLQNIDISADSRGERVYCESIFEQNVNIG